MTCSDLHSLNKRRYTEKKEAPFLVVADLYFAPFWFFTRNYNALELSSK